jgi:hypothetical protein
MRFAGLSRATPKSYRAADRATPRLGSFQVLCAIDQRGAIFRCDDQRVAVSPIRRVAHSPCRNQGFPIKL